MSALADRYRQLRQGIASASLAAGRPADAVDLVAVSKTHPASSVAALLAAGQRRFGENRVQEAADKYPALKALYPDLALHLIGPLQSNKVRQAVALFDVIETVDRDKLARALASEMAASGRRLPCLIEVNIAAEPQKAGVKAAETADFLAACRGWGLEITGLMCIPPQHQDPAPHFCRLRDLADALALPMRSMGMSHDYAAAIACGATEIRVGTALFGARDAAA